MEHVHHLLPHDELKRPREVSEVTRTVHRLERGKSLAVDDPAGAKETLHCFIMQQALCIIHDAVIKNSRSSVV